MSIDRRTSLRYGFGSTYNGSLGLQFPGIPNLEDEPESIGTTWLEDNGFSRLRFDHGGNQWSGPRRWAIVVKDVGERLCDEDSLTYVDPSHLPYAPVDELMRASELLGKSDLVVGWHVFMDVM